MRERHRGSADAFPEAFTGAWEKQDEESRLSQELRSFVTKRGYPCVGASSVVNTNSLETVVCSRFDSDADDRKVIRGIYRFARKRRRLPNKLSSFAVLYQAPEHLSEAKFEKLLWQRLQNLHDIDQQYYGWDPEVSSDVSSPRFSFSLAGRAFFVIGMHPASNRASRRFHKPALIFNLHSQFQELRASGRYEPMRDLIRQRDLNYSGSAHPMLEEFGNASEALQYSGRRTPEVCPFSAHSRQATQTPQTKGRKS